MTLEGLLYAIGQIGINDKLINFAAAGGSIYEINDLTVRDYPILYVSPTGTHRMSENYTTYQVTIFFIDRLLEDNSNGVAIHSTAVEVLKNIIKKIAVLEGVAGISDEYTIQLFTETEKMKDRCNGAYATIEIMLLNESTCIMPDEGEPSESGDTPTENWYLYFNNPDGETIPAESTAYTVEWRTNIPDIPYIIYGPDGVIESGSTDGEIRKEVDFAENKSTATTREYTFMFLKENGANLSGLTWYQAAVEVQPEPEPEPEPPTPDTGDTDYYFNFTVSDNQVIPADATGFTVSWRTNIPWVSYVFDTPTGITTGSLNSGVTDIYLTFPANTSIEDTPEYSFNAFESSQGNLGSINWKQEEADAYFEFITQSDARISSAATSYHVDWDTNYESLRYTLEVPSGIISSGALYGSGHTFVFPTNPMNAPLRYTLTMKDPVYSRTLGTLSWVQEANGEVPHDYSGEYLTFEILSAGTLNGSLPWQYSLDNGQTWQDTDINWAASFIVGDKVLAKSNVCPVFSASTATFNVYGNIMSLFYGDSFAEHLDDEKPFDAFFANTFKKTKVVSAEHLILPTYTNEYGSYAFESMFNGCTSLVNAPAVLPCSSLCFAMYRGMFRDCTSLVTVPVIMGEMSENPYASSECFREMFAGCTSLTTTPVLPYTHVDRLSYYGMFSGCTSLVNAPELPAVQLEETCYRRMFAGCTSLVNAPELPAAYVPYRGYTEMFSGCTSLTTAPVLRATAPAEQSYGRMFAGCSRLNHVECLATDLSAIRCTLGWLANVSPTGTFIKKAGMNDWVSGPDGIPDGWTVQEV